MLKKKIQDELNKQINRELYSSYLYLSMAAALTGKNFAGMGRWLKIQAKEEVSHAMKFLDYIIERGGKVKLAAIDAPPADWASPLKDFEQAYHHEQLVTGYIYELVNLAQADKDHATVNFLQWFVSEQVEEEAHASEIYEKLKMVGDAVPGLFALDHHLGARE